MFCWSRFLVFVFVSSLLVSCGRHEEKQVSSAKTNSFPTDFPLLVTSNFVLPVRTLKLPAPAPSGSPSNQVFQVRGVVRSIEPGEKTLRIRHEDIPGYMKAMEMSFDVKDTNELRGLQTNDTISFRMIVTDDDAWIDQIKKLDVAPAEPPPRSTTRIVKDVDPLNPGDALPNYNFTNERGQRISTSQFKGQALAITFLFTRCPYPLACPKMSSNFQETQEKLLAMTNGPTNWHLLTISIDPEYDTPEVLKAYAQRYKYDPRHWNFATGDLFDITAIAEQVDLQFWRLNPNEPISHNLRCAVIDTRGRLQTVFRENKWTSDQLVAEIVKAAAAVK